MKYHAVLTLDADAPVVFTDAVSVHAASHRQAAVYALHQSPESGDVRAGFRRGDAVTVWVWSDDSPRHSNGAPFLVHKLSLTRGLARVDVA